MPVTGLVRARPPVEILLDALPRAARVLERVAATTEVLELHVQRPDLQEVFLRLTGRGLRD